jgi:hydroxymethylglutaryl-CoA lyase
MKVKIVECPRDAMQGLDYQIETSDKIAYLQALLACGFDVLDCGSFVSPAAIPQMADTRDVLSAIHNTSKTQLLVIVANKRGALEACSFPQISYLGFPFSVSSTFQMRNTHLHSEQAFDLVVDMLQIARSAQKELVVYLSMCFGNPYGDPWSIQKVMDWVERLAAAGITRISLSDTIGIAQAADIEVLFSALIKRFPDVEFGAHLHTRPDNWEENIKAALRAGCRSFDGAIKGLGGCPMASDSLTGNLPTENLIAYLDANGFEHNVSQKAFQEALKHAGALFH